MYLADHARLTPDKPALICASSGEVIGYAELEARSNRLAHALRDAGLQRGDNVGVFMENHPRYLEIVWAAMRSGLYVTPINRFLTVEEAAYIGNDAGIQAMVSSEAMAPVATQLATKIPSSRLNLMVGKPCVGWQSYEDAVAGMPAMPVSNEWLGHVMFYSSGTTGQPKGIDKPLPGAHPSTGRYRTVAFVKEEYGFDADTVYLSTAPLYHAAPATYALATQFLGGTVVMMEKFDAEEALQLIERHRITHSQWVPTMFVRMLKLPVGTQSGYDFSSHQYAIHAGAPCAIETKQQMIDWWGPIIYEYYGGSEQFGRTQIDSVEWLAHRGSVGKARGARLRICDDAGNEVKAGVAGAVYFESADMVFAYRNDPLKTASALHPLHPTWGTYGDIGYVDEEGFLYLTDRRAFTIVSGGVNIYPQAIENALIQHPLVADVAVFGVPSLEMGEDVKAVVELLPGVPASLGLGEELLRFLGGRIARYMLPRSVDFVDKLPRLPTGKLYKRQLRDSYWRTAAKSPASSTSS